MSVALNAVYLIALCVCGWRVIYRAVTRTRGESVPFDALLWLSAVVLVLTPVVADVTNVSGWGDPDTLYPTILSVGGISGLLAWDVRSVWSRAHRRAISDGG
jgi:hypothetical protein